jgi:hypothetical protein
MLNISTLFHHSNLDLPEIWDRLAGTFRVREDTRTITLGLPSYREERYQRLWGFLITPFQ